MKSGINQSTQTNEPPQSWLPTRGDGEAVPTPVAREAELERFRAALVRSRFIVVTGPEGVGKTHFVGWAVPKCMETPVAWIRATRSEDMRATIAAELDAPADSVAALAEHIGSEAMLIVVDDLHLVTDQSEWVDLLRHLLEACARLTVVAVSRACPDVYGMAQLPLPLLSVPAFDETTLEEIRQSDAMELWCQLYRIKHGSEPTPAQLRRGATQVRRVDGLPAGIVASLESPVGLFGLIKGTAARAYSALSPCDANALAVLGQFQRWWPIELGVAILQPWMNEPEAVRCIDRLVNASAVQRYSANGHPATFRIMRSIREHGHAMLRREKRFAQAASAYTSTMCMFARTAYERSTTDYPHFQQLLVMHFADLDAAWHLLVGRGELDEAMELVADVWPYWNASGNMLRYQNVVERILQLCPTQSAARVRCMHASGVLYHLQGKWRKSQARHREAIALAETVQHPELQGLAWFGLGQCGLHSGEPALAEQALLAAEKAYTMASTVHGLANVQMMLAIFYWNQKRLKRAVSMAEAALRWQESVGEDAERVTAHALIGRIRLDMDDEPRATFFLFRALDLAERIKNQTVLAETLEGLAKLSANQKKYALAARLFGAAASRRSHVEHPGWPSTYESLKLTLRELNAQLGSAFDVEFAKGRRLSWGSVLEQLGEISVPVSPDTPVVTLAAGGRATLQQLGLTPREREVLVLLAVGAEDREIAEALRIGVRTVHSHVHQVILKLGATSRSGAVASAWRMGVLE